MNSNAHIKLKHTENIITMLQNIRNEHFQTNLFIIFKNATNSFIRCIQKKSALQTILRYQNLQCIFFHKKHIAVFILDTGFKEQLLEEK